MKDKIFFHNIIFRILSPVLYGPMAYVLILLVFDSLSQLSQNFLSTEVLVLVIITGVLFECLRALNLLFDKLFPSKIKLSVQITIQTGISMLLSVGLVSGLVSIYFIYIEGFSSFRTELFTFNGIFLVTTLLYELLYLSLYLLQRQNTQKLDQETFLRQNLEFDLKSYKNDINPNLLFSSFEVIISLLGSNPAKADNLIVDLSSYYRYCLLNRSNELVLISDELTEINSFLPILNYRFSNNIKFQNNIDKKYLSRGIVPCSFLIFTEYCVSRNIINHLQEFIFSAHCDEEFLILSYNLNKKLNINEFEEERIQKLTEAYSFYSDKSIEILNENGIETIRIPLLIIDTD